MSTFYETEEGWNVSIPKDSNISEYMNITLDMLKSCNLYVNPKKFDIKRYWTVPTFFTISNKLCPELVSIYGRIDFKIIVMADYMFFVSNDQKHLNNDDSGLVKWFIVNILEYITEERNRESFQRERNLRKKYKNNNKVLEEKTKKLEQQKSDIKQLRDELYTSYSYLNNVLEEKTYSYFTNDNDILNLQDKFNSKINNNIVTESVTESVAESVEESVAESVTKSVTESVVEKDIYKYSFNSNIDLAKTDENLIIKEVIVDIISKKISSSNITEENIINELNKCVIKDIYTRHDSNGRTILNNAIINSRISVIDTILKNNDNTILNVQDKDGTYPLQHAIKLNNTDIVKKIENKLDKNIVSSREEGYDFISDVTPKVIENKRNSCVMS